VIRLVVLMYPLSLPNVDDLLFERGIDLCHENRALLVEQFRLDVRRRYSPPARQPDPGFQPLAGAR
jgi:hypothetical protein